jgi:hypothetical protein
MGEYVIKAARDEDLYLIWSTSADGASYVGTRDEIRELLWDRYKGEHPHSDPRDGYSPDDAMRRADDTGTSARDGDYGWNQTSFVVGVGAPGNGYDLPRTNLVAYARALQADDALAAQALLVRSEEVLD